MFLISSLTKPGQEAQLTSRIPSGLKVLHSAGFILDNTHILWASRTEPDPAYEVGQYDKSLDRIQPPRHSQYQIPLGHQPQVFQSLNRHLPTRQRIYRIKLKRSGPGDSYTHNQRLEQTACLPSWGHPTKNPSLPHNPALEKEKGKGDKLGGGGSVAQISVSPSTSVKIPEENHVPNCQTAIIRARIMNSYPFSDIHPTVT